MPLPDLHRAIAEHTGTFLCERINKPQETKTVNFQHHMQPPAALAAPLPDVGQLPAFYATMGGVLLYHDANTGDAARYVETAGERFDLVVFDLTPPDSPAAGLYTTAFYTALKRVMTPDAVLSLHLGSPYFHAPRIAALLRDLRAAFRVVRTMGAFVPLYGSQWLMATASDVLDPAATAAPRPARFRAACRRAVRHECRLAGIVMVAPLRRRAIE